MKRSLLWELKSSKGPPDSSFLFGTMHIGTPKALSLTREALPYLNKSGVLYNETNMSELIATPPAMLPDDCQLDSLMSAKSYEKVSRIFKKVSGVDLARFNKFYPMYLNDVLAKSFMPESGHMDSVDMLLFNYALNNDIPTYGIESVEEQRQILKNIPISLQAKSFIKMMKNIKGHRKALFSLVRDYEQQDIQKLYKKGKKQLGKMRKKLLYQRNRHMANRIVNLINSESAFYAIGCGHLSGDKGILAILKRNGIDTKAIRI